MAKIICINSDCATTFVWDESSDLEPDSEILDSYESGAKSILVTCTLCGCENKLWIQESVRKNKTVKKARGGIRKKHSVKTR